ncbi:Rrf2 family transcriptional regulator [Phaeovibrio sulfidiphilus]|uniref:Rrf2 family transcriptional regulator n=1 Tax=Phaeovibrio sulfidiphilus TaxID=1220600 RepID=A0A8J6YX94_9PROT|nr:Rrf2 family transcriptional regulator [Phaeovibrio sulfidiphilus]MBE1237377.1 Rrf2 family transcriptional regulator [Phaeovibrio sulfidiphilus]
MVSLSRSTAYGVLVLAALDPQGQEYRAAADVSAEANIPRPYLSKILARLQEAGLLEGKRGRDGGLRLAREAHRISLLDVVHAIDGEDWADQCLLGLPGCSGSCPCPVHAFWSGIKPRIEEVLQTTSIDRVRDFTDAGWKMTASGD